MFRKVFVLFSAVLAAYATASADISARHSSGWHLVDFVEPLEQKLSGRTARLAGPLDPDHFKPQSQILKAAVTPLPNGQFDVADDVQRIIPQLIDMNNLAYAIGKSQQEKVDTIQKVLTGAGWTVRSIMGASGRNNRAEDVPGFIAYNAEKKQIAVVFRGSQTKQGEVGSADWEVNLDLNMIDTPYGKMHRGFWLKTQGLLDQMMTGIRGVFSQLNELDRQQMRIFVSGHSQGAALGSLAAAFLAQGLKDDDYLGRNFDNTKSNQIVAYLLSAPRVANQDGVNWIHKLVGQANIIRQNVIGDLVPIASPGKTTTGFLREIPVVGSGLAEKLGGGSGAASVGYLAADLPIDVLGRTLSSDIQGFSSEARKLLTHNWTLFKSDPLGQLRSGSIFQSAKTLFSGLVKDLVQEPFARLHYGSTGRMAWDTYTEPGAYFQPQVVAGYTGDNTTLSKLLSQGAVLKEQQKTPLGFFSRVGMFLGIGKGQKK